MWTSADVQLIKCVGCYSNALAVILVDYQSFHATRNKVTGVSKKSYGVVFSRVACEAAARLLFCFSFFALDSSFLC